MFCHSTFLLSSVTIDTFLLYCSLKLIFCPDSYQLFQHLGLFPSTRQPKWSVKNSVSSLIPLLKISVIWLPLTQKPTAGDLLRRCDLHVVQRFPSAQVALACRDHLGNPSLFSKTWVAYLLSQETCLLQEGLGNLSWSFPQPSVICAWCCHYLCSYPKTHRRPRDSRAQIVIFLFLYLSHNKVIEQSRTSMCLSEQIT